LSTIGDKPDGCHIELYGVRQHVCNAPAVGGGGFGEIKQQLIRVHEEARPNLEMPPDMSRQEKRQDRPRARRWLP
jgi:hypothetical protein